MRIDDVLRRAAGRPGHIFNLGHGILPTTPVDNVRRLSRLRAHSDCENDIVSANGEPIGVLVMAYGGPNSLAEIPGYLADIRSGRPTPRAVVDAIVSNYQQIGGKSPLLDISRRQNWPRSERRFGGRYRCYLGMRHWAPWIEEVVRRNGAPTAFNRAVSVVLAPHFSKMSVGRYQAKIADGLRMARGSIEFAPHRELSHRAETNSSVRRSHRPCLAELAGAGAIRCARRLQRAQLAGPDR